MIIRCDGFLDKQIIINQMSQLPLTITLKPAMVDMGTIEITEKRQTETLPVDIIDKEELEKIPTGGDPLQALSTVSGVVSGQEVLNRDESGGIDLFSGCWWCDSA